MVLASTPDEVVTTFSEFQLKRGSYDALVIEAELSIKSYGQEPFPAWTYGPTRFPSIYRNF
jgi:hypothetical protein